MIPVEHLSARRGATFGPRGWPLLSSLGAPLRDPDGIVVTAQVRNRHRGDIHHAWRSDGDAPNIELALITLPGDPLPQVCALLKASAAETALWSWRRLPYDVLVDYGGRIDEVVHGDFTVHRGITE